MDEMLNEIRNIENKYGLTLFGMGLTQLFDAGHRNFSEEGYAEKCIEQIMAQGQDDAANGKTPILTPEFQCKIIRCAAELAHFSPWTLFAYIKKHVAVASKG